MKYKFLTFLSLLSCAIITSCNSSLNKEEKAAQQAKSHAVMDSIEASLGIQGANNEIEYEVISIGSQTWCTKNLNVEKFRNGEQIPEAKTNEEWEAASRLHKPVFCNNGDTKLYNWYAVMDKRGLAPAGFRVPNRDDWFTLLQISGHNKYSIFNSKCVENLKDASGFNAKPDGHRYISIDNKNESWWWTYRADASKPYPHYIKVEFDNGFVSPPGAFDLNEGYGMSVRCIKGESTEELMEIETLVAEEEFDATKEKLFGEMIDIEGNSYKTVKIGTQIWMAENLRTTKFANGDPIKQTINSREWTIANLQDGGPGTPAWCYYDNDALNDDKFGKLYNWHVVSDNRGIAPIGWHVPSNNEINILIKFLGDESAKKIKSTEGWSENKNGTNESGFNGLPSGRRNAAGSFGDENEFSDKNYKSYWWTKTNYDKFNAYTFQVYYNDNNLVYLQQWLKRYGNAIRLVKD